MLGVWGSLQCWPVKASIPCSSLSDRGGGGDINSGVHQPLWLQNVFPQALAIWLRVRVFFLYSSCLLNHCFLCVPQWGLSWYGQGPRVQSSGRPARVAVSHSHLRRQCWAWRREETYTVALASPRPLETSASGPAGRQTPKGWFL